MSKFRDWQETRKEVSVEDFKKIDFDAVELFALEESPPEKIFVYRGGHWIMQNNDGAGSYFWLFIERDEYCDLDLEVSEMRLHLWAIDENCEL